jgi:hypothetical protein
MLTDQLKAMKVHRNSVIALGNRVVVKSKRNVWRVAEVGGDWLMSGNLKDVTQYLLSPEAWRARKAQEKLWAIK